MAKRFLITAGSTREMIDKVRSWSNIFTGNTGLNIARAVVEAGDVDLLTGNPQHMDQLAAKPQVGAYRIHATGFTSQAHLRELLEARMREHSYDAVFMSAAVSDYEPQSTFTIVSREAVPGTSGRQRWIVEDVQADKVKSNHGTIAIVGVQTQKLVDLFRNKWKYRGLLVKFKLEVGIGVEELIRIGQISRVSSGAEYLVANTLDMVRGSDPCAYLISDQGYERIPRAEMPGRMLRLVNEFTKA